MAINAFSNFSIVVSDGGTVPSIDYLPNKTYVDIGSGNVLKVTWDTPVAANNTVDSYIVYLTKYDSTDGSYESIYTTNIGLVNEFYLKSSLLAAITKSFYSLFIRIEAVSKYGAAYNGSSNTAIVYVSRGCGIYNKVEDGYTQPVMKRALAFTKLAFIKIFDDSGKALKAADGTDIYSKVSSTQDSLSGWALMQEAYSNHATEYVLADADGAIFTDTDGAVLYLDSAGWQQSNILHEVLTDLNGDIITDMYDENVYVL